MCLFHVWNETDWYVCPNLGGNWDKNNAVEILSYLRVYHTLLYSDIYYKNSAKLDLILPPTGLENFQASSLMLRSKEQHGCIPLIQHIFLTQAMSVLEDCYRSNLLDRIFPPRESSKSIGGWGIAAVWNEEAAKIFHNRTIFADGLLFLACSMNTESFWHQKWRFGILRIRILKRALMSVGGVILYTAGQPKQCWRGTLYQIFFVLTCQHMVTLWMCDLLNVLFSTTPLLHTQACGFPYWIDPSYIQSSSLPAAFSFSQHYCLFQRILPYHVPKVGQTQFWHCCLQK